MEFKKRTPPQKKKCSGMAHTRRMRFDVKIKHHSCYITDHEIEGKHFIHCGGHHSKIEAVYSAVVFFVEWYNLQITNIQ